LNIKCNEEMIKDIFCSGSHSFRYDRQLIVNIYFLIKNKLLFVDREKITSIDIYHNYIDDIKTGKIPVIDIEGGQSDHMALKLIARDYLIDKGYKDISFESNFEGYKPDVITNNKKIIIERGNTNPDKIFNYFKNPALEKFIVIPYLNTNQKGMHLYTFTPGDELSEFLLFKEEEELKKIRNDK